MKRCALLVLALAVGVGLTGCDININVGTTDGNGGTTDTGDTTSPPKPSKPKPPPKPRVASQGSLMFQSPTKNIGCVITADVAECAIRDFDYTPPPQPDNCDLPGWGQTLGVDRARAGYFACADSLLADPSSPVLRYGKAILHGRFACASSTDGVRCVNRDTRHGFLISREQAQAF